MRRASDAPDDDEQQRQARRSPSRATPSASTAIAGSSRSRVSSATAPIAASATSTSLCPLPTVRNSTTGLRPHAAAANATRPGRTRAVVSTMSASVARLPMTAMKPIRAHLLRGRPGEPRDASRQHREQRPVHGRACRPIWDPPMPTARRGRTPRAYGRRGSGGRHPRSAHRRRRSRRLARTAGAA